MLSRAQNIFHHLYPRLRGPFLEIIKLTFSFNSTTALYLFCASNSLHLSKLISCYFVLSWIMDRDLGLNTSFLVFPESQFS